VGGLGKRNFSRTGFATRRPRSIRRSVGSWSVCIALVPDMGGEMCLVYWIERLDCSPAIQKQEDY
jgi:hypothetical protein